MTIYALLLTYDGIDVGDVELLTALHEALPDAHWHVVDGQTRVTAYVAASTAVEAARALVSSVHQVLPTARPLQALHDLVTTSDVADRADVHRETVRLWSTGARGPGGFPPPLGSVSRGMKVWAWADISRWLTEHYGLAEYGTPLTVTEVEQVNTLLKMHAYFPMDNPTAIHLLAIGHSGAVDWTQIRPRAVESGVWAAEAAPLPFHGPTERGSEFVRQAIASDVWREVATIHRATEVAFIRDAVEVAR